MYGHQFNIKERSAEATKSALELCLMAAVEKGTVKTGDFNWKIMNQLIEEEAMNAIDESDRYNDRS